MNIESPCVGVCKINKDGICTGCFRDVGTIKLWKGFNEAAKLVFINLAEERKHQFDEDILK